MNMERYFREHSSRRQMTRQTTAPPFYRNQASHPVDNRLAITGNTNNKTPRTQNIRPRMNNFTKFENISLSERTQTKCRKCDQLGHLPNQCQNFRIPSQRKAPPGINHIQEQSELTMLPQEDYSQYDYNYQDDQDCDFSLTSEQESTCLNKDATTILIPDTKIDFFLIDDDFPIIEDGLLGLPGLDQYRFELSNETLKLDNNTLPLQQEPTLAPGETVQKIVYFEEKPTPVCFINGGKSSVQVSNIIENTNTIDQIQKFKSSIRLSHIEKPLREPMEKILLYYIDVFVGNMIHLHCTCECVCKRQRTSRPWLRQKTRAVVRSIWKSRLTTSVRASRILRSLEYKIYV